MIKDKLYNYFVRKNPRVCYEYERYVQEHLEEHYLHRFRHIKLLLKLNYNYRIKHRDIPYLYWDYPMDKYDHKDNVKDDLNGPLISIIVTSYNYEKYIVHTLDAILRQSYKNYEVIIVDDGSKDNSVSIIEKYVKKSSRISLYQHPNKENRGLVQSLLLGISNVKGEYIAFCESDDVWTNNHLEEKVKMINKYGCPKVIINDIEPFGNEGRVGAAKETVEENMRLMPKEVNKVSAMDMRSRNLIATFSSCMVYKEELLKCNFIDVPRDSNIDWWLWRQLCITNEVYVVRKKITRWRMHDSYMTREDLTSVYKTNQFVLNMDKFLIEKYPEHTKDLYKEIEYEYKYKLCEGEIVDEYGNELHNPPYFTIIMPTFNRAFCIEEAINSVFAQTYNKFELIIIDDGSVDDTYKLIKSKYKKYIKMGKLNYKKIKNSGVCKARNIGLKMAQYKWIAYIDSDNIMCEDFLETFAKAICGNPDRLNFYSRCILKNKKRILGREFNFKALMNENFIDLGSYVHNISLVRKYGLFDEKMTRLVDWELIIRQCKFSEPLYIKKILYVYNDDESIDRITNSISIYDNLNYLKKKHFNNLPVITTMITTYNHESYIKQAIDSAIKQKGNFIHEIIISDDGSTDGTHAIIRDYAEKYPNTIRDISFEKNTGISPNMQHCFREARGNYVAILEGDDYWISEWKLNRQLKFMKENDMCSMVFSRIEMFYQNTGKRELLSRQNNLPKYITGKDLIRIEAQNPIANFSSCMIKTEVARSFPKECYKCRFNEIVMAFYITQIGPIGFMKDILTAYRLHEGGTWSSTSYFEKKKTAIKIRETARDICELEIKPKLDNIIFSMRKDLYERFFYMNYDLDIIDEHSKTL